MISNGEVHNISVWWTFSFWFHHRRLQSANKTVMVFGCVNLRHFSLSPAPFIYSTDKFFNMFFCHYPYHYRNFSSSSSSSSLFHHYLVVRILLHIYHREFQFIMNNPNIIKSNDDRNAHWNKTQFTCHEIYLSSWIYSARIVSELCVGLLI